MVENDMDLLKEAAEAAGLRFSDTDDGILKLTVKTPREATILIEAMIRTKRRDADPYPQISL